MNDRPAAAARLSIRGLACRRGERILFEAFDLDVGTGETVWLRAANGFGKTTLLRTIVGLARPERGTVAWAPSARRIHIAHANALKDDLTVVESVHHAARLQARSVPTAAVDDALGALGLLGRRQAPIRTLSQGQRRRVALAQLFLPDSPDAWILDEPFDALDDEGLARVADRIASHAAGGGLTLFTSHVAPGPLADRVRTVRLDTAP